MRTDAYKALSYLVADAPYMIPVHCTSTWYQVPGGTMDVSVLCATMGTYLRYRYLVPVLAASGTPYHL